MNRIIDSTYAEVSGQRTALAGCSNSHQCDRAAHCLRADERLKYRHPFSQLECELVAYIPTTERPSCPPK